ncbi:MAG: sigma-70 family RNA polymerase sigma factor [Nocardioides sp.]
MRVARGSRRAPAGRSSPEADRSVPGGTALDRSHDVAHRTDPSGGRAGGRQPARAPAQLDQPDRDSLDDDLDDALDRARDGDEAGFAVLWRTLHAPLLRYLTVRGNHAPEDLAAETWLQVVRDLRGFDGDATAFRAWLFTVARHRAVDQGRARASRPVVPVAEPPEVDGTPAPSAEHLAVERDATAAALRLVASLPAEQAEMVMLRVVAGLDVAVVAELVGKTPGAVRVAVHRALKSLARDPRARSAREVV